MFQNITGDVIDVDDKMLHHLDMLENHPTFYKREDIEVKLDDISTTCTAYFLQDFKPELLELTSFDSYSAEKMKSMNKLYTKPCDRPKSSGTDHIRDVKMNYNTNIFG